jgi:hypothetical protein
MIQLFAALMGVGEPRLLHGAILADALVPLLVILYVRSIPRGWPFVVAYVAWAAFAGFWKFAGVLELACIWAIAANAGDRERVMRAWILGAAVLSVVAIVSSLSGVSSGGGELGWGFRVKGLARSTNMLASLCLIPLLVTAREKLWPLFALFALTIALAVSRTALAAAFGLVLLWKPRGWKLLAAGLVAAAIASIYVNVHGAGPGIRWLIGRSALENIFAHPLFGSRPAATAVWADGQVYNWDAHSTVLDVAATMGIPALIFFAGVIAVTLRRAEGLRKILLWAMLFDAMTIDVEDFRHFWLLLGLAL